jgi:hypothetical protein
VRVRLAQGHDIGDRQIGGLPDAHRLTRRGRRCRDRTPRHGGRRRA